MFPPVVMELVPLDKPDHFVLFNFPYRRYYEGQPVKRLTTRFDNWSFTILVPDSLKLTSDQLNALKQALLDDPKWIALRHMTWIVLTPVHEE